MEKSLKKTEDTYTVPNLEKGIKILELLAYSGKSMTLHDIRKEVRISQTTAYRILQTLVRHGYLSQSKDSKKFKLSRKMLTVGFQSIQEQSILEMVLPEMRKLRDVVKETVSFGVMGEEKGLFIEQILGTHPFCFVHAPGKLFELHCSAPGKAMMAFMPEITRKSYLEKMKYEIYNRNTITSEEAYLKELNKVRDRGYALDMEEELYGVVCVGAPVFNYTNVPCGSIWISGPKDRLSEEVITMVANAIMAVTRNISFELGYTNGDN
jgi:DNA-binding IclR family transcriptional regulator